MLVSRKHPIRYYLGIILVFILWAFIFIMTSWLLFSLYQTDSRTAIGVGFVGVIFFYR
jgi:DNA-binding transcriptional regulator of glucitol operon